ncbi:hypothetical protein KOW79_022144 [Hemibagrus wyckioides]|uniref:Uncharacterized protein n=1 Tax=Hemibagrus wyckioides TaxID=337641 RepID=A0A9D3S849_9TELE|nr:hypothetical protein KOW79_022144 [Hemibagrus wyckioides]
MRLQMLLSLLVALLPDQVCCIKPEEQEQLTFCSVDGEKVFSGDLDYTFTTIYSFARSTYNTSAGLHRPLRYIRSDSTNGEIFTLTINRTY